MTVRKPSQPWANRFTARLKPGPTSRWGEKESRHFGGRHFGEVHPQKNRAVSDMQGKEGGLLGRKISTDYVYIMQFDGDRIAHMTKVWNAGLALKDLGWA